MTVHNLEQLRLARYRTAQVRGCEALIAQVDPIGRYGEGIGVGGYYKTPTALALGGKPALAQAMLDYLDRTFADSRGHFFRIRGDQDQAAGRGCDLYEDMWLAWGALEAGREEMGLRTLSLADASVDWSDGGVASCTGAADDGSKDLRSTAISGFVSLKYGRTRNSLASAQFLVKHLELQDNPEKQFFLVRTASGDLSTDYPADRERYFVLEPGQERPLYYALGLPIAFLASLYTETSDAAHLKAAEGYAEVYLSLGEPAILHDYSGKLALGLALLYEQTDSRRYLDTLFTVLDYLCDFQDETGLWTAPPSLSGSGGWNRETQLDRTAEYCTWLALITQRLEGKFQ